MPKKKTATVKQIFAINELLTEHLHKFAGSDLWVYDIGWSDLRIADEIGCASTAVSRIRKEMFGEIRARHGCGTSKSSLARRVDDIETFLKGLDMGFKS